MSGEKTKTDDAYDTAKRVETRMDAHEDRCTDRDEKLHHKIDQTYKDLDRKIRNFEALKTSAMASLIVFLLSAIGYLLMDSPPWQ